VFKGLNHRWCSDNFIASINLLIFICRFLQCCWSIVFEAFVQILNTVCRVVRLVLRMGKVISVTPSDLLGGI